jgi:DNA mismatch endonuclease (patch repair protein)
MADVHDTVTRSRNMAAIKSGNTKPELFVRKALHAMGLRFRLHRSDLPGKPDIVLPRHHVAIFVHGCFWHLHDCHLFKWPEKNEEFWRRKLAINVARDEAAMAELRARGWRIALVWECALKGKNRLDGNDAMGSLAKWICAGGDHFVLRSREN